MLNDCSIFQETFQWQNCNNWVKSNAKKKKTKQKIEYRDNKSANSLMYLKIRFWRGEGKKEGQKNIEKKKKKKLVNDGPVKGSGCGRENGQRLKACFPGASRSVWHSFHSWRAWSRLSKEPRARQTRQKERVKDSVTVSVILSLRHTHSSCFSFYIYATYNKYIHIRIQMYIYIYMQSCVCSMQQQQLRPSLSCRVLRFSSW